MANGRDGGEVIRQLLDGTTDEWTVEQAIRLMYAGYPTAGIYVDGASMPLADEVRFLAKEGALDEDEEVYTAFAEIHDNPEGGLMQIFPQGFAEDDENSQPFLIFYGEMYEV